MSMKVYRFVLTVTLSCLFLAACSSGHPQFPPQPSTELLWPDPTLPPKVQWLGEIRSPEDAGIYGGILKKFQDLFFGQQSEQILRPYGVFSDGERIAIADPGLSALHILSLGDGEYRRFGEINPSEMTSPIGITADSSGNLFVTDSVSGFIYRLNKGGKELKPLGRHRWQRPTGIAFNPLNKLLYVAETVTHQIVALDRSGQEKFRFGGRGRGAGEFNFPTDLWIDHSGRVFVTDALNSRIQVFNSQGEPLFSVGARGDLPGHLNKPKGVATDREGWIYICDALQDTVQVFDPEGRFLFSIGSRGQGPGEFWMPSGITLDADGLIYVSDVYNQRIQVFRRYYGKN